MIHPVDAQGHQARVLIVDDDPQNRALLAVKLAGENLEILVASSGEEALAMVAREPPNLILLDVLMPGMNGYQIATRLKADVRTKSIPIIMITALGDANARMLGLLAGAEDFLSQPVDRAELCVRVRNLLRLKAYADFHNRYSQQLEGEVDSRTAELAESERLYRSTFDAAPVGIAHVGLDGRWLRVNQRLCDFLGYTQEEIQNPAVHSSIQPTVIAGEAEAFDRMASGFRDRHVIDEKPFQRRDGSIAWARVNMSVHRDATGNPRHFILVIEDVGERRTLETQLRQANKMDAVGRLASAVAHDFNNLLTVILGFAELVNADESLDREHGQEIGEIIKAATRAAGLTKQLLIFGRQQGLDATALDVNTLIQDMATMLGRLIGPHIDVRLDLAPNLCLAFGDRGQLEQVVMNLVVNARDAMPHGGVVTIETAQVDLENSPFHPEEVAPGAFVMLSVTDTGRGMGKETKARVFEPFFTTKEVGKGTGLGLSTTYGIVKQSKGYIWVDSEVDRGTTFKVYLPCAATTATVHQPTEPISVPLTSASETVLLVEDEDAVRHLSKRILSQAGYRVLDASCASDAEILFADHAELIDIVVTDVIMPGISGPALIGRLRAHTPTLRALYMSGHSERTAFPAEHVEPGVAFVQKPFTAAELGRQVRAALDR